jgi:hypothetical protein
VDGSLILLIGYRGKEYCEDAQGYFLPLQDASIEPSGSSISAAIGVFYDGNPFVLNTSHRSGAETLFAIVQVQYEEHALQTDATEFSNSSLYNTAEIRYASLPSPHICGPPVLSNYKNTHDHDYHTIPINVHFFLIVNKHIYFKKSPF